MPPRPDRLAARITATTQRMDAFLSRCEETAGNPEKGLTAEIKSLTGQLRRAAADVA